MELVVVGLPGSGKTAIGRRVAARHGATFVDLDEQIERESGMRIPEIFEAEGEAGFRRRERAAIDALGAVDAGPRLTRVIAPGGGGDRRPARPLAALPRPAHGLARRATRGGGAATAPQPDGPAARRRPRPDGHDPGARRAREAGSTRPRPGWPAWRRWRRWSRPWTMSCASRHRRAPSCSARTPGSGGS